MMTVRPVNSARLDVLVVGEVLVEVSSEVPLDAKADVRLGFSGDALNAAAAAADAGAVVELLCRVPDDELGDRLIAFVNRRGVGTRFVRRTPGQHGVYFTHADKTGRREFVYVRRGSAGSQLAPADLGDAVEGASVVVCSGVTCAISESARATVLEAARRAGRFVYDPNYRPRLSTAEDAASTLRALAPHAEVVTPSWPGEVAALLPPDACTPEGAARAILALGAASAVVTCGHDGAVVAHSGSLTHIPPVRVPEREVVDQTGAGDRLTGTLAAWLAKGEDVVDATTAGVAAAADAVRHRGGLADRGPRL